MEKSWDEAFSFRLSTSSMTCEMLSLSITVCAGNPLFLRRDRARSPSGMSPPSVCAAAKMGNSSAIMVTDMYRLCFILPQGTPCGNFRIIVQQAAGRSTPSAPAGTQLITIVLSRNCTHTGWRKTWQRANDGTRTFSKEQNRSRKSRRAGQAWTMDVASKRSNLQQSRGTKTCDWIRQRNRLSLKEPAGYRKSHRRIAQVHQLHKPPPKRTCLLLGG